MRGRRPETFMQKQRRAYREASNRRTSLKNALIFRDTDIERRCLP
jgi:hypothetical protein